MFDEIITHFESDAYDSVEEVITAIDYETSLLMRGVETARWDGMQKSILRSIK